MKTARAMFGAVVHKGKIIVVGGVNESGLLRSCEAYDFGTNKYVLMYMKNTHLHPCCQRRSSYFVREGGVILSESFMYFHSVET